ncbi:ElaB/YqjD/DUF883 family membrane-anchored ribosome-binding protein [Arthrobacter sp. V4I6]|uniref:hypothetical protein n=1 Tax=unclassified Arthrobacter TaxID=235627 RepID=UPI002785D5D4|nr:MULTISPECIES: hypothetical protein [unclassified Arthrobacter]MDQ0823022.1 ElaB/YqjD/DUF883 family membrane-anchored ribosome-binding protein [Arthrobacter sp. V1I7]MDQ0852651.1 ElaB/YqjD/DUF883 family membrane-anchored ribosome-binding protein [Arthrobacter sp. V4I6]
MTENQWHQDGSLGTPPATQQTPVRPASTFPAGTGAGTPLGASAGAGSKKDAAKDEAAEVTRQAADAAQNVAETAKTEAANVAAEVKTNARDLLHQAKTDLTDQAGTQQQKVAEGLRSFSTELHSMASASDQPGVASDLVRQAAERSSAVASWLDGRDPGSLLTEVKSYARQRPGTFLLLAAGAGVLAGRLSRSLSAGAPETTGTASGASVSRVPDTGTAVPPPSVQLPAPATTTASAADTYPPNPLDSDPGAGGRQDRWGSEPVVPDPFRTDPPRDDPFDSGRR